LREYFAKGKWELLDIIHNCLTIIQLKIEKVKKELDSLKQSNTGACHGLDNFFYPNKFPYQINKVIRSRAFLDTVSDMETSK
jgi:hypothetical protein